MPAGYTISVPPSTSLAVGASAKVIVSVAGPKPWTMNRPYTSDDLIHVRFTVNPKVVRVAAVAMLQQFDHGAALDHTKFGWTWTGNVAETNPAATKRTFVAYEWFTEGPGDPMLIEKPFDLAMGPLMEITLVGVAPGQTKLDLVSAVLGEWQAGSTMDVDGWVTVA